MSRLPRLVLLGADGQLGWELRRSLAPLGELIVPPRAEADLERPQALTATLRALDADVVVNAAAYTAVDTAERERERAQTVNAEAPGAIAQAMAARGGWLVHYSSDYVFDGSGDAPRDEEAPTAPLNVYGRSKLDGEQLIRTSGCQHLILRTSWVYAARGQNFARTMLKLAAERDTLRVVADQIGAPTGADLLADVSAHALRAAWCAPALGGTYHVAAAGETSWHGYACFIVDAARAAGVALRVRMADIEAVPSSSHRTAVPRPLNSRLDTRKLRHAFGLTLPPWQHGVRRMLAETLLVPQAH